jgi:hypothetical protein
MIKQLFVNIVLMDMVYNLVRSKDLKPQLTPPFIRPLFEEAYYF